MGERRTLVRVSVVLLAVTHLVGCGSKPIPNSAARETPMIPQPTENPYIVYSRETRGVVSIANAALIGETDRKAHPYVVRFNVPYASGDRGLPSGSEFDRIEKVENALIRALKDKSAIHVGHLNGSGMMRVYFYASAPIPLPVPIKTGLLSRVTLEPDCRHDPTWGVYAAELEPTELESEISRNRALLRSLAKQGDIPTKPRVVDFALIFPSAQSRAEFLNDPEVQAYAEGKKRLWESDSDFWCEFNTSTSIEENVIAELTARLRKVVNRHRGEFDGWACPVTP